MTTLDVSIRAKFVNELSAGAKAATSDLKSVGEAAQRLGTGASAGKLDIELSKVSGAAKVATADIKGAQAAAQQLGTGTASAKVAADIQHIGTSAAAAENQVRDVAQALQQLGAGTAGTKVAADLARVQAPAQVAERDVQDITRAVQQLGAAQGGAKVATDLRRVPAPAQLAEREIQDITRAVQQLGATRGADQLAANLDRAGGKAKSLRNDLADARREAERLGTSHGRVGTSASRSPHGSAGASRGAAEGPNMGALATAGAVAGRLVGPLGTAYVAKKAFDQSVNWNAAWAEVKKKVNDADEGQFQALEKTVRRLSLDLGIGRVEMAGMVAEAGAGGIAYQDLEKYMRLTAKAAVGWDMDPREASEKLANMRASMGYTIDELAVVADKINALGDNSAAKERDILEMFGHVGSAAKEAGVQTDATLAILTAVRSGGMDTGVAARWFGSLTGGLRTAQDAPKRVQKGLQMLGLSAKQVSEGMKKDGVGTILDLFQRLEKSPKAVEAATAIFGREWWDETMRAKGGLAEVIKQLEFIRNPANYNGSLDKGFAIQAGTAKFHLAQLSELIGRIGEGMTSWTIEPLNRAIDGAVAKMTELEGRAGWWDRWSAAEKARLEEDGVLKKEEQGPPIPPDKVKEEQGPPIPLSMKGDAFQRFSARARQWLLGDERTVDETFGEWLWGKPGQKDQQIKDAEDNGRKAAQDKKREKAAAYVRDLIDQRERLSPVTDAPQVPEHLKFAMPGLKAGAEDIDRQLKAALASPELGPVARKVMEEYVAAIGAEGAQASAEAQRIAEQIRAALNITLRPQIEMPSVPGSGGGGGRASAPRGGGSDQGGAGGGGARGKERRADAGTVIHQHIYGGGDAARVARHAQREQERAIRTAQAGALHDLGSWS